jgi:hypothetical protein
MNKFEIIFTAVMATIIIHLAIAVIFMSVKVSAMKREIAAEIYLSFEDETPDPDMEKAIELSKSEQFQGASVDEMLNIIKNIADRPVDIDPKAYEEMVREELIKSGMLEDRKQVDGQEPEDENGIDEIAMPSEEIKPKVSDITDKPEEKGTFKGPTRIFYDLAGRYHVFLPIPIYKCEGAGQITLAIEVDRSGIVVKAEPASQLSTTKDGCLTETAIEYAYKSRFNTAPSAPVKQSGFLTFVFVSQD